MLALCLALRDKYNIAAVTNDIFTREDCEFLTRNNALPAERIRAIETGGCPHAAVREDISANLAALTDLHREFNTDLLLIESGGDNLAANYSRELADYIIYVIDVSGGDKIPRKGGPGITQSDLLIVNKTDLAELIGADLGVMDRDSRKIRYVYAVRTPALHSSLASMRHPLTFLQRRWPYYLCSGQERQERQSHCRFNTECLERKRRQRGKQDELVSQYTKYQIIRSRIVPT